MERAILIAILDEITPILIERDFLINICVDGDLETNKTLANVAIVNQIYADLKHCTNNIRKNLRKD